MSPLPDALKMINLEEAARKRRERLINSTAKTIDSVENIDVPSTKLPENSRKRSGNEEEEEFCVPKGEILLDASGAEILSLDSKYNIKINTSIFFLGCLILWKHK